MKCNSGNNTPTKAPLERKEEVVNVKPRLRWLWKITADYIPQHFSHYIVYKMSKF